MTRIAHMYDVSIVGAGPIGCYCAYLLAKRGMRVALLEEHSSVGENVNCAGIISKETFERFSLSTESIDSEMHSLKFISPSGKSFTYRSKECLAYIADRPAFDRGIAEMARKEGAEFLFDSKVYDISYGNGYISLLSRTGYYENTVDAKIGIIATGYGSPLPKKIGCGIPPKVFSAAQVDVEIEDLKETEIYMGNEIVPGSFAWAVPLNGSRAKIGLSVSKNAVLYLKKLLHNPYFCDRIRTKDFDVKCSGLPLGALPKSHAYNIIILGEAAGQLKSTTHGGVYYGLICAEIAADHIYKALSDMENCSQHLRRYEESWKGMLESEINLGIYLRQLFSKFRDDQIDYFVELGNRKEMEYVIRKFKFDWHEDAIRSFLRSFKHLTL